LSSRTENICRVLGLRLSNLVRIMGSLDHSLAGDLSEDRMRGEFCLLSIDPFLGLLCIVVITNLSLTTYFVYEYYFIHINININLY
jgi:hypothetical protein